MSKNKFTTYLLYAIGEIFLVVIGILIAVSINDWNADRKDREREAFLLNELNREMKLNLVKLDTVMKSFQGVVDGGQSLMNMFPIEEQMLLTADFGGHFQEFLYCPSYDPSHGIVRSIVSSGDINLIQNDELRQYLLTWEDVFGDYKEEEEIAWNYGYALMNWLAENFQNPRYVQPVELGSKIRRALMGKIIEKTSRYGYALNGEDNELLRAHMERIIQLTEAD